MRINTICPGYISSLGGPSYVCQALLQAMSTSGFDVSLFCISGDASVYEPFHRPTIPHWAKPIGYRLFSSDLLLKYTEWRYLHSIKDQDIAYIWDDTSIGTYEAIKSANHTIITEGVNTHQATSKQILDTEWRRLGLTPRHGIDDKAIAKENAKLELADFIFSPSDEVTQSLLRANIPSNKIIPTSYGCKPDNILLPEEVSARADKTELTAIFVGRLGIRKGVHLLLDYWVKAGVKGKLKLVGNIEPTAAHLIEPYLGRADIELVPYTSDLRSVYLNADVFLFPSLEEGSPLVTYLALGAGLPCVVSPMGGGSIIDDGHEGLVIDPHEEEQWVASIRRAFSDGEFRATASNNAYGKAGKYLWSNVGRLRAESLRTALAHKGIGA